MYVIQSQELSEKQHPWLGKEKCVSLTVKIHKRISVFYFLFLKEVSLFFFFLKHIILLFIQRYRRLLQVPAGKRQINICSQDIDFQSPLLDKWPTRQKAQLFKLTHENAKNLPWTWLPSQGCRNSMEEEQDVSGARQTLGTHHKFFVPQRHWQAT